MSQDETRPAPVRRARTLALAAAAIALIGCGDYLTGSEVNVFVFYFLPVAFVAAHAGRAAASVTAVLCAAVSLLANLWAGPWYTSGGIAAWNAVVRLAAFLVIGELAARLYGRLAKQREELDTLRGLLPICPKCKRVRDDKGYWQQIENYLEQHAPVRVSHGLCRHCARTLYPDLHAEQPAQDRDVKAEGI